MKLELAITKERVPYLVDELGEDRVEVREYNNNQDLVIFEVNDGMDILSIFHAGIQYGSDSMRNAVVR
jgi:hypothetical protein